MNQNFKPQNIDNDYIMQDDEFINPEYADQIKKLEELEMLKALQERLKQRQSPVGSDMYEELRNPPKENPFDSFEKYDEYNRLGL